MFNTNVEDLVFNSHWERFGGSHRTDGYQETSLRTNAFHDNTTSQAIMPPPESSVTTFGTLDANETQMQMDQQVAQAQRPPHISRTDVLDQAYPDGLLTWPGGLLLFGEYHTSPGLVVPQKAISGLGALQLDDVDDASEPHLSANGLVHWPDHGPDRFEENAFPTRPANKDHTSGPLQLEDEDEDEQLDVFSEYVDYSGWKQSLDAADAADDRLETVPSNAAGSSRPDQVETSPTQAAGTPAGTALSSTTSNLEQALPSVGPGPFMYSASSGTPVGPIRLMGSSNIVPPRRACKRTTAVACLFCRRRKIACGGPPVDSSDNTCMQCRRRQRVCEYPDTSKNSTHKLRYQQTPINL